MGSLQPLEALLQRARELGASDLHLEGGLPPAFRVQGELKLSGEALAPAALTALVRELLGAEGWAEFGSLGAADLSRAVGGVRCRINALHSARGAGLAIRLLTTFQATLQSLNLHPDLKKLGAAKHGLVLVCGPTGSGKSSTVAALLNEINVSETRHLLTIESPIEYVLVPRLSLIRQRQVGRDTPSFDAALRDALREDPDVLMVGELRDPETMRLTLSAAETGHLVISTLHSASCAEALGRLVGAFPADSQASICAQLADCLAGVVCQRLRYRADLRMRVPECEILLPTSGVRGTIRTGQLTRLATALEGGGTEGQWTWERYRAWLDARTEWVFPSEKPVVAELEPSPALPAIRPALPKSSAPAHPAPRGRLPNPASPPSQAAEAADGVMVIDDVDEDPAAILERMGK